MINSLCSPARRVRHVGRDAKKLILVCLIFSWQHSFTYADTTNATLTLSAAIERAIQRNPGLRVFDFRNEALNGQLETANLRPGYEVGLDAENFAGSDELSGLDAAELTISLSSVLEMGDKRAARRGVVSRSRSVLDAQRQVASLDILGEVTRRFVEVLAAQAELQLAKEANQLAVDTLRIVRMRARVGATPDAEVSRASAAASQSKLTLQSTKQQLEYRKMALAALWGESSVDFETVAGDLYRFGRDVEFPALLAKVEQNPAIQVFTAEERLRDAELRIAKTQSKADITWSVGVRRFQESDDSALVAGFSMPLFSARRNSGAITTAIAQRNEVAAERDVTLLDMRTQLYRAFHNRQQAILAATELQSSIIPALTVALNGTKVAYEKGRYGYLEYISAQQELLSARRTLIESASSALTYGAEIEQLTAEPVSAH